MRKLIAMFICAVMVFLLTACGGATSPNTEDASAVIPKESETETSAGETANHKGSDDSATSPSKEDEAPATSEDDAVDDASWEELENLGRIETENGVFYVSITIPASMIGEDVTQESIDAKAGETYTSAKLNDDGSVSYKMTKKQHKAMLDKLAGNFEQSLQQLVDDNNYSFTKITHNDDFTSFDVTLSSEELGLMDSFSVLIFYTYGGMYSIFTGHDAENIAVNFYGASGALVNTANSSEMGG